MFRTSAESSEQGGVSFGMHAANPVADYKRETYSKCQVDLWNFNC
jgi:hypothetical protein